MAKLEENIKINVEMDIKLSLWDVIKFRILGINEITFDKGKLIMKKNVPHNVFSEIIDNMNKLDIHYFNEKIRKSGKNGKTNIFKNKK